MQSGMFLVWILLLRLPKYWDRVGSCSTSWLPVARRFGSAKRARGAQGADNMELEGWIALILASAGPCQTIRMELQGLAPRCSH